jgi:predicted dehydrogenase
MTRTLRIGVLGTGFIAGAGHMPGIAGHPAATAVVACDNDPARLREFAQRWDIPATVATWQEALDTPGLDAVSICLPNALHAEVAQAALRRGVAVLCEKPMALRTADADAMVQTARLSGTVLAIKVHNRYRRSSLLARQVVDSGVLGEVYHAEVRSYRRSGIPGVGSWFTQRAHSGGGALADCGIHPLDAACWLLGSPEVRSVAGVTSGRIGTLAAAGKESVAGAGLATYRGRAVADGAVFDVEDEAFGLVRFADDRSLSIAATWAAAIDDTETINLFGTRGGLRIDWSGGGDAVKTYGLSPAEDRNVVFDPAADDGLTPWSAAHLRSTRSFIDAVLAGGPSPVDPAGVAAVMRIIESVYTSAAQGDTRD